MVRRRTVHGVRIISGSGKKLDGRRGRGGGLGRQANPSRLRRRLLLGREIAMFRRTWQLPRHSHTGLITFTFRYLSTAPLLPEAILVIESPLASVYIEFASNLPDCRFPGEHEFHPIVERGAGRRIQHCHVSEAIEDERRAGPSNPDEPVAADHLGRRSVEREARGQLPLRLSENGPVHRFREAADLELSRPGPRSSRTLPDIQQRRRTRSGIFIVERVNSIEESTLSTLLVAATGRDYEATESSPCDARARP